MNSRFVSSLLLAFVTSQGAAQATTGADSAVVAKALDAVRTFQKTWEREWIGGLGSQHARMNRLPPGVKIMGNSRILIDPRRNDLECYFLPDTVAYETPDHTWGIDPKKRQIASKTNGRFWTCPNWRPPHDYYVSQAGLPDERLSIDNALEPAARSRIRVARQALLRELLTAARRAPQDSVLLGQYIRMLVDNGELTVALVTLDNCQARAAWCHALRGYVQHRLGQFFDAEDAFLTSLDSLAPAARCAASSVASLIADDERKNYAKSSCEKQSATNRTLWWLADPLWSMAGNDRFSEQFARRVMIALHSALQRDERYNWSPYAGGDAIAETIERYGWMSYTYSLGPAKRLRWGMLPITAPQRMYDQQRAAQVLGGYRSTFEYSVGRVHVIPPMSMVEDPFSIANADWSINAPGGELDMSFNWWPVEHYAPEHPLVKLVDQQTAFLRRQSETLIAYATSLARTDLARKLGDSVSAVILDSRGPGIIKRIGETRVGAQDRLTFLVPLFDGPSLVSVEVPWTAEGERGGRARFGVKPPPALSTMRASEIAISDPIILTVRAGAESIPNLADSAVALMLGSTTLAAGTSSVGIYWETYGIAAGDSVDITLTIQRNGGGGTPVATSWSEPQPGRNVRTVAGAVPIQMRSVVVDISAIPIGTYTLDIAVRKRGAALLTSAREFTIR